MRPGAPPPKKSSPPAPTFGGARATTNWPTSAADRQFVKKKFKKVQEKELRHGEGLGLLGAGPLEAPPPKRPRPPARPSFWRPHVGC